MEALRSPSAANWVTVAGGEGGVRCRVSRVVHLRAPSGGAQQHGAFSRILVWRRATAVAPAFPRPPSPFSAFPSPEKQEEVKTDKDASPVEARTASHEPPAAAAETEQPAEETQPQEAGTETDATQSKTQVSSEISPETSQVETVEAETDAENELRTVRVRFMLQKSCRYGEQFLLVGEHHALGSWNPDKAIPMEWSDGHVWVADDVELPVGEEIKHKFILRPLSGKIKWQPGPDKVLQTCESADPIVVTGDWESAADEKTTTEMEKASDDDSTAAGADAAESKQAEVTDGNDLKTTVDAREEKRLPVHEGDAVLIPGLASVVAASPAEAEGNKSGQASPVAAAGVGSSAEEVIVY